MRMSSPNANEKISDLILSPQSNESFSCISSPSSNSVTASIASLAESEPDSDSWIIVRCLADDILSKANPNRTAVAKASFTPSKTLVKGAKRRRPYSRDKQQKVNVVRQVSACIRCQILKEECNDTPYGRPCNRCCEIQSSAKVWTMPCLRTRITEVEIFRTDSIRFPLGIRKFKVWDETELKSVSLHYDSPMAPIQQPGPTFNVLCRRFRVQQGDVLCKKYPTSTGTKVLNLPNYALFGLASTVKVLEKYVDDNLDHFALELPNGQHRIQQLVFAEALRQRTKSDMVDESLRIAIMTRFLCRSFGLVGSELLGIGQVVDLESPYFGRVPIPPMLDAQLDELWRGVMMRRKKCLLSKLKSTIIGRRRQNWLDIFLTTFIILSVIEMSYQQKMNQLLRHKAAEAPLQIFSFGAQTMLERWDSSAENILSHYHAISGSAPLSPSWLTTENIAEAGLDAESTSFLRNLSQVVQQELPNFQAIDNLPKGSPMYWCSQLFVAR